MPDEIVTVAVPVAALKSLAAVPPGLYVAVSESEPTAREDAGIVKEAAPAARTTAAEL